MFEIRASPLHGRGLFARRRLPPGRLVVACPALLVRAEERPGLEVTPVGQLLVEWDDDGTAALPLGAVSLVNHHAEPNCELVVHEDPDAGPTVQLWTRTAVRRGDELLIDYAGGDPDRELWFDAATVPDTTARDRGDGGARGT